MVRKLVSRLGEALKNFPLLRHHPEQYHDDNFNSKVDLYYAVNRRRIERSALGYKVNGEEDSKIVTALLAYVPDLKETMERKPRLIHAKPVLVPHKDVDLQERIMHLVKIAPDGAFIWDERFFNDRYVIFGDIFDPATRRANQLTGRDEQYVEDAVKPLVEEALRGDPMGARTLKAISIPLAIPGAVSYVLKGTVYQHGIGKAMMFDGTGVRAEAYLDTRHDLPQDEYLYPRQRIAIVRRDYAFDEKLKRTVQVSESIIKPQNALSMYSGKL